MHPYVLDAQVGTLVHGLVGSGRLRPNHDSLDTAGDGAEVGVARIALDFIGIRIHRKDLIAAVTQALVDDVAAVTAGMARDPGDRDALLAQELGIGSRSDIR
jgi:hypothetical protein